MQIEEIKPYKQRKNDTCAIACMLMVLEYYKIIPKANWQYERKYYKSYHSYCMDGTPLAALAWHFSKNGLHTEIYHSSKDFFDNSNNYLEESLFNNSMKEYKEFINQAQNRGTEVINGINIDSNLFLEKLQEGKILIIVGMVNDYFHAILLCGYENEKFIVCNPLYQDKNTMSFSEINNFINTPIGKWFIAVSNEK